MSGERLMIAHREVAGPAVLRGAIAALVAGPTAAEAGRGLTTAIPSGTELLDVALHDDGIAIVDLSAQFASGGGSLSMTARISQLVFTATQFDNVEAVRLRLDGEPIDTLGGEGIDVSEPIARANTSYALSGFVLIDTPTPGSTVGATFTVVGEGDVYEGQFPIEVWAGGVLVGGQAPVTAGAWGDWRPFEVTLTLDPSTPDGPIELVAYDPGGCGTDPECPPIVRTVVPLTLKR